MAGNFCKAKILKNKNTTKKLSKIIFPQTERFVCETKNFQVTVYKKVSEVIEYIRLENSKSELKYFGRYKI